WTTCHQQWPSTKRPPPAQAYECDTCHRDKANYLQTPSMPQVAKFGAGNGMVPDPVPPELTGLTMVEQQMIARAHPICKVIRQPGGHYAYEGHVINISQDITTIATDLPWLPNLDELPIIIIQPPNGGDWKGREFKVNPTRVETALVWLIAYSPAYRDVRIDIGRLAEL
ncbi:unnamed protein product, partial [Laminaria digitata]